MITFTHTAFNNYYCDTERNRNINVASVVKQEG